MLRLDIDSIIIFVQLLNLLMAKNITKIKHVASCKFINLTFGNYICAWI